MNEYSKNNESNKLYIFLVSQMHWEKLFQTTLKHNNDISWIRNILRIKKSKNLKLLHNQILTNNIDILNWNFNVDITKLSKKIFFVKSLETYFLHTGEEIQRF